MCGGGRADGVHVLLPHSNARDVSRWVARLPMEYLVCRQAEHWVVVGPTGIFVVGGSGEDAVAAAESTRHLAHRIRTALSDLVPWVPFIDALLVSPETDLQVPCTVVELASLEMALLTGSTTIDDEGLEQLRRHVPEVLARLSDGAGAARGPAVHRPTVLARPLDPA